MQLLYSSKPERFRENYSLIMDKMKLQRKNNYQKQRKILCNDLKMINPPKDSDSHIQQTIELQNNTQLKGLEK